MKQFPKIHVLSRILLFRPDRPYFHTAFYFFIPDWPDFFAIIFFMIQEIKKLWPNVQILYDTIFINWVTLLVHVYFVFST